MRALLGGSVPESAVASRACLLLSARHRVAVHLDGQEVREEARRPRRLRQGHPRREEHGAPRTHPAVA